VRSVLFQNLYVRYGSRKPVGYNLNVDEVIDIFVKMYYIFWLIQ